MDPIIPPIPPVTPEPPARPLTDADEQIRKADVFTGFGHQIVTPITTRRMYLLLTRSHYSDSAHFGQWKEKLDNYVWSKHPKLSKIDIQLDFQYQAKRQDERPAIFVGCDDFIYHPTVVDNFKNMSPDNSGTGYVTIGETNVIIRHIAASPDEAMTLCEVTAQFFLGIRPLMQQKVRYRSYNVKAQKTSRPFERAVVDPDQQFISDLLINITFNALWLSVQESHRIKTINFESSLSAFGL